VASAAREQVLGFYSHGLSVAEWLSPDAVLPPREYLQSAPISYPMIGLVQLTAFAASLQQLRMSPGQFVARVSGASGHSQGTALVDCTVQHRIS
jgi:malonyl CoA-acyl carrier protein transacylase